MYTRGLFWLTDCPAGILQIKKFFHKNFYSFKEIKFNELIYSMVLTNKLEVYFYKKLA